MWLFTRYGFFSAVCARQSDGRHGQPVDADRMMIRARDRRHLQALIDRFPEQLGNAEILENTGTDYRFRLFVSKSVWVEVVSQLAEETDYDNFKSAVGRHLGADGADYIHALHSVWLTMYNLQ
jgi:hypothetical protein